MTMTQHLSMPGPLRTWWESRSAGLSTATAELAAQSVDVGRLAQPGAEHAAAVGGVVGRRIEHSVDGAPPYAAILAGGVRSDACLWSTHAHLRDTTAAPVAAEWRPTPAGWQRLVPGGDRGRYRAAIAEIAEIETTRADERALIAAAGGVASLEAAYRSGGPVEAVSDAALVDALSIVERLTAVPRHLGELCGGRIVGHSAPVLAPHWADGDVLIGPGRGGGYGLYDVKTVGSHTVGSEHRTLRWLWQLLSYAALDVAEDLWRIRAVGVILPRQDRVVTWPVADLWSAAGITPAEVRELADLLARAYRADLSATA